MKRFYNDRSVPNIYERERRRQRRYALLRFAISWTAIVIVCLFTLFGVWSFFALLLAMQP